MGALCLTLSMTACLNSLVCLPACMCVLGPVSACISVCEGWWPIEGCMGVVFVRIF